MHRKPLPAISALLSCAALLVPASSLAADSPRADLYRQVKLELKGKEASCSLMSQAYSQLFSEAGRALGGEESCEGGVYALYEARKAASGKYYKRQTRAQLKSILKGKVKTHQGKAIIKVSYRGTPPGWKYRPRSRARETFYLVGGDSGFLTDWVQTIVRPPIARPTPSR